MLVSPALRLLWECQMETGGFFLLFFPFFLLLQSSIIPGTRFIASSYKAPFHATIESKPPALSFLLYRNQITLRHMIQRHQRTNFHEESRRNLRSWLDPASCIGFASGSLVFGGIICRRNNWGFQRSTGNLPRFQGARSLIALHLGSPEIDTVLDSIFHSHTC